MKGGDATNGTLNVARPGRPGNAGLVKKGCPGSRVVRAYDTNVPQQWNERRWSRTQKHSVLSSGVEFRCTTTRNTHCGKERCAFHPGELCCEEILQCEDAADSGSLMILFPCVVAHAVGISFSRLQKIKIVKKPETGAVLSICTFEDGHVEGIHVDKVGQPCKPVQMSPSTSLIHLAVETTSQVRQHQPIVA